MSNSSYILDVGQLAQKRLAIQQALLVKTSQALLVHAGLQMGMSVLDVGCGTGEMSTWLAEKVGMQGKVDAIDISDAQIAMAKQHHGTPKNLEYHTHDIFALDQNFSNQFDLIYCRLVLSHLTNPKTALQKLIHCLKPNGIIVCEEAAHDALFCYPRSNAFKQMFSLIQRLLNHKGIKPGEELGYRINFLFQELALSEIQTNLVQPILKTEEQKQLIPLTFMEILPSLIQLNFIDEEAAKTLLQELQMAIKSNPFIGYIRLTQISAQRKR